MRKYAELDVWKIVYKSRKKVNINAKKIQKIKILLLEKNRMNKFCENMVQKYYKIETVRKKVVYEKAE